MHYPSMKKPEHLLVGQHFRVRLACWDWVDETLSFNLLMIPANEDITADAAFVILVVTL